MLRHKNLAARLKPARRPVRIAVLAGAAFFAAAGLQAKAADLGGDCCADLEARVAELEAVTVKHGNRKLEVKIFGAVSTAGLFWDDGGRSDVYGVTNDGEGTKINIEGEGDLGRGSKAGFLLEIGLIESGSGVVSQDDRHGPDKLEVPEANVWLENERLGRVTLGVVGGELTDNSTEVDISGTALASYSGVEDVGGGFFLRHNGELGGLGELTSVAWGDLINHLPGVDGLMIRYDTPRVSGFGLTLESGEDFSEALLTYTTEDKKADGKGEDDGGAGNGTTTNGNPFEVSAALSYFSRRFMDEIHSDSVSGSVSMLHKKSGMSLTVAGGQQTYVQSVELNDGTFGKPDPGSFFYVKAALLKEYFSVGDTGLYGEYGRFRNFLGRGADTEAISGLAALDEPDVCSAGQACLVANSQATIWGMGVVQHLSAVESQLYLGYRHHTADINLVDDTGAFSSKARVEDFDTVIVGMLIDF